MIEYLEKDDQEEEELLYCPICEKSFKDMRGLTSHARHLHGLAKQEIVEILDEQDNSEKENNSIWKIIGGTGMGVILLIIFTAGRFR